MKYQKASMTTGAWVKGSELMGISRAVIVSETAPQPSQFLNKDGSVKNQDVCKIRFEGKDETFNISLNRATINGLVDAFGEDSVEWQNKQLSVETEKVRVAGVARTAVYLIPEGYEKIDNEEGFAEIRQIGVKKEKSNPKKFKEEEIPVIDEEEVVDVPL